MIRPDWPHDRFTVWGEDGPLHETTDADYSGRRRCALCGLTAARDEPMIAPCPGPTPCALCTAPAGERHHDPDYQMHRTPYDIPRHDFTPSPTAT